MINIDEFRRDSDGLGAGVRARRARPGIRATGGRRSVRRNLGAGKMVEAKESGTRLMISDVRMNGCFGAVRVNTGQVTGHIHQTWGTDVWTTAKPSLGAERVYTFPYSTTIRVQRQIHAEMVSAEGYDNDVWSYLPDYRAWLSNIYIKGPAWLDGVLDRGTTTPVPMV